MEFLEDPKLQVQPTSEQFELTVFGPGCGECIVLHCGNGNWCVIDSCRYHQQHVPIALQYLECLGIDPAAAVKSILVTHWHDDHIGGMATLVQQCTNARFHMSNALHCEQFFQLVMEARESNKLVQANSSSSEFEEILEILESRLSPPPSSVEDGSVIFQDPNINGLQIQAISPSPETVRQTRTMLADRILTNSVTRRFRKVGANDLSVAAQVVTPSRRLLLKADLENCKDLRRGWNAALSSSIQRPADNSIIKIGHHGSQNADHDQVWSEIVSDSPLSIVTPYSRLSNPLPTEADIARIVSRGGNTYCTTWPLWQRPPRRRKTDAIIKSMSRNRRSLPKRTGVVRVRFSIFDFNVVPSVELFGSACQLVAGINGN